MLTPFKRSIQSFAERLGYTIRRSSFSAGGRDGRTVPGAFYERNGYYIFRNVLATDGIRRIRDVLEREIFPSKEPFLRHIGARREPHEYYGAEPKRIFNALLNPHREPETENLGRALLDVICGNELTSCLQQIDHENCYSIHQIILFFVAPGTDLHIDAWGVDTVPHGYFHTVWIPLEQVTLKNGALCVAPWPRGNRLERETLGISDLFLEEDPTRRAYNTYHDSLVDYLRRNDTVCALPQFDPGDFIVFSSLTPHGTLPAPNHPWRMAMQVLVRPSRLPWSNMLASFRGDEPMREDEAGAIIVNDHWRIV